MLEPQNRTMLLESLRPPEGYQLSLAVGTTYSLDLVALLTAPIAFTLFDQEAVQSDPLGLLHTMRGYADRMRIFCQTGQIKIPNKHQLLFSYLENSVFEVSSPKENGVFHPKVWALRYLAENQPVIYRLLVMSRNLTFDRSWDTSLVLEGVLTGRANRIANNYPLGDFFQALPSLSIHPLPADVLGELDLIVDEVQKVEWDIPRPFDTVKFWSLGLPNKRRRWPFEGRIDRLAVISPFLTDSLLNDLAQLGKNNILIGRTDAIEDLSPDSYSLFEEIYAFNPGIAAEEKSAVVSENLLEDIPDTGLHAKLYIADMGYEARVWTGSANATRAAFYENVEFLVELKGRKHKMGIKALLKESEKGQVLFRDLLENLSETADSGEKDHLKKRLENILKQNRLALTKMGFKLKVVEQEQNIFDLLLERENDLEIDSKIKVHCWPITLEYNHSKRPIDIPFSALRFSPISLPAITSFIAFSIQAQENGEKMETRFVLNLPLRGLPDNRQEMILRAMLKDRQQFLRYLLMLLQNQSSSDLLGIISALGGRSLFKDLGGFGSLSFPLLELMLDSLATDPKQIDKVQGLIEDLRKTPEGKELLPDHFDSVWDPIWEARQQLRSKS